jgi:FKBP-type peptidyl-prolyl cis-trans isomerase
MMLAEEKMGDLQMRTYREKKEMDMKRKFMVMINCIGVLGIGLLLPAMTGAEDSPVFKNQQEKISYGIGVGVARDFKRRGVELELDSFLKGLRDELSGAKLLMTEKDLDRTMDAYAQELRLKQEKADMKTAEENKKAGEAFLAENAKKEGVVTLPSGLQYKILQTGKGDKPMDADAVQVNYRGTLINGKEIDSSYQKAEPTIVKMNGVIPGLREALKLMSPGSKWQIFIPAELAYGDRKVYQIGPNATLIFEMELVSVLKSVDPGNAASAGKRGQ